MVLTVSTSAFYLQSFFPSWCSFSVAVLCSKHIPLLQRVPHACPTVLLPFHASNTLRSGALAMPVLVLLPSLLQRHINLECSPCRSCFSIAFLASKTHQSGVQSMPVLLFHCLLRLTHSDLECSPCRSSFSIAFLA